MASNPDDKETGDGFWGENAAGDISVNAALEEYHDLERQLTETAKQNRLHQTHSRTTHDRRDSKTKVAKKAAGTAGTAGTAGAGIDDDGQSQKGDVESGESTETVNPGGLGDLGGAGDDTGSPFDLPDFLRRGILDIRTPSGGPAKRLGVSFKNLTVKGVASGFTHVTTLPTHTLNSFGPDLWRLVTGVFPSLRFSSKAPPTVDIVRDVTGTVRHGEIMLVLGRPGSGCSTLLKAIANQRDEFVAVDGEVYYGAIPAGDQHRRFRGEVVYCEEDDQHFPTLTVWQTLRFALENKTRKREKWTIPVVLDSLLQMFGIEHTRNTLVGDQMIRGISGGERKRVSLAETLATKASVVCWDNSTRGLDASTALSFAKSLRVYTDVSGRTTLVTLYQAGESIYELVDKVLVLDKGRVIYQGEADQAAAYFEDLGYLRPPRQTTADFLTSITDENSRRFQPGKEASAPKTAEELNQVFRKSVHYQRLLEDVSLYERDSRNTDSEKHHRFEATVKEAKSKTVPNSSVYTVSFVRQVAACIQRQQWLMWGDMTSLKIKLFTITANALIVGSLFWNVGDDTSSAYARSSLTFFSIVFVGWLMLGELLPAVTGRTTVERQRAFAFYRPSAVAVARAILDLPLLLVLTVIFCPTTYFLGRLDVDAAKFWIFYLFVFTTTFALVSMYRMFAAVSATIDDAVRWAIVLLSILLLFAGYVLPQTAMLRDAPWFGWIHYTNFLSFAFEAVLSNEFTGMTLACSERATVPRGPDIDSAFQGCGFRGSTPGNTQVSGDAYLASSFEYYRSNIWRNYGILLAFIAFNLIVTCLLVEFVKLKGSTAQSIVFATKSSVSDSTTSPAKSSTEKEEEDFQPIGDSNSVFTFKNVHYSVATPSGPRKLLNSVSGYAKSGRMVALMGTSGAGKTTLLNTISQRQTGAVSGEMLINGQPLGPEFQRNTGFCEQVDLHEGSATVREAFEFSALLRQERSAPTAEKKQHVDRIIGLLELGPLQHALVGSLSVEQRKRVTIGVELAAKPGLLLFLDEPTSGLDSQSAFQLVRFLRRLCDAGQAIICTIHQPSSDLIEQFDSILALDPTGSTYYFGPVGENGDVVVDYFAKYGANCAPGRNVAEFILETVSNSRSSATGGGGGGNGGDDRKPSDWSQKWLESDECSRLLAEIDDIAAKARQDTRESRQDVADTAAASPASKTGGGSQFAASNATQAWLLTKRTFIQQWREPSYVYGRLFTHFVLGIFAGFTFYMLGNDVASLQNRMFGVALQFFFLPVGVINAAIFKLFVSRGLWEFRELPSRTYGWVAFCTAMTVCELPASIVASTVYFLLWYFPSGMPRDASTAGYTYLMTVSWGLFMPSLGQWIAAFGSSVTVVSALLPLFLVIISLFNGIFLPYDQFPVFWKYWVYYINPSTWLARGMLSAILPSVQVECAPAELARFDPPPDRTCGDYATGFLRDVVGGRGYLVDANATAGCEYCPYTDGTDYMAQLNVRHNDKWMSFGIMCAFNVFNWAFVFFLVWACRIKGWTFGFGTLSNWWSMAEDWIAGLVYRRGKNKKEEGNEAGQP